MFVKLSKRVLTLHKWTGNIALIIAIIHMLIVLHIYGIHFYQLKMLSGMLSIIILIFLVLFGWLRWYRATVFRRYTHWTLGYLLIFSIIIHLLL